MEINRDKVFSISIKDLLDAYVEYDAYYFCILLRQICPKVRGREMKPFSSNGVINEFRNAKPNWFYAKRKTCNIITTEMLAKKQHTNNPRLNLLRAIYKENPDYIFNFQMMVS
jgi:hypothetical protein